MRAYYSTDAYRARRMLLRKQNWQKHLLTAIKSNAKRRGIFFDLTVADVPWNEVCPVLGVPIAPAFGSKKPADTSVSIDRIDNSKGYVPGNVVVVSYRANRIKNDASLEELERLVTFYKRMAR